MYAHNVSGTLNFPTICRVCYSKIPFLCFSICGGIWLLTDLFYKLLATTTDRECAKTTDLNNKGKELMAITKHDMRFQTGLFHSSALQDLVYDCFGVTGKGRVENNLSYLNINVTCQLFCFLKSEVM